MPSKERFEDAWFFLQRFFRDPGQVASVWPSSRFLAARMFRDLDLRSGDVLLEYGPGTGSFTRTVAGLRSAGIDVRYLGIEKDPGMHEFLAHRFPSLDFVLGDAADVLDHCADHGLPPATAVISGLPLMLLPRGVVERIFSGTQACLRRDGLFRTFSYAHSYPTRKAGDLRDLMSQCFEESGLSAPVLRNLPPAVVLTGRSPRPERALAGLEVAYAD